MGVQYSYLLIIYTYTCMQFPYESLFRSIHFALMENACRDYLFVVEFLSLTPSTAQDVFDTIFGKTLAYLLVTIQEDFC